ncbi:molybdopterin molybdotransferase MoeA [Streptomyces sp. ST2-7A]|uniref:molybdopterin molybdotransferase MoeA n=1 Tax=Streptomyces sp. ST2-7A TaxID=2907214 RepID=UPI001F291917|nr:molybdopterin molybdotransferase MoeA [Streptomyces sp. ST2-7A]MCE7079764.1 molybdopterin molybdotransferase MoeA [Streptomyces sp. ST2-7A]
MTVRPGSARSEGAPGRDHAAEAAAPAGTPSDPVAVAAEYATGPARGGPRHAEDGPEDDFADALALANSSGPRPSVSVTGHGPAGDDGATARTRGDSGARGGGRAGTVRGAPDPDEPAADRASPRPDARRGDDGGGDGDRCTGHTDRGDHIPVGDHGTDWESAHRAARRAGRELRTRAVPLGEAIGHTLAEPLTALTDLPAFDTAAMDGWAVSGPGPWGLESGGAVLAGHDRPAPLADGLAVPIATGARVPPGTTAVLRRERGRTVADRLRGPNPAPGADIRPRGQECRTGAALLPVGTSVTPAVLGLAAAAGYDRLTVRPRPRVAVLVLGDELLHRGLPTGGRIRDAIGPMIGPWLTALGADPISVRLLGDLPAGPGTDGTDGAVSPDSGGMRENSAETSGEPADTLVEALNAAADGADLVLTSGGTGAGPVDRVHPALRALGARVVVDGVAVRPGHPMLLAELPGGVPLVGLPGNPLAAVSAVLLLVAPVLRGLTGRPEPESDPARARLIAPVSRHPRDTRLVPVRLPAPGEAEPVGWAGPAMLRGIAVADAVAVIPPGPASAAGRVRLLELPRP